MSEPNPNLPDSREEDIRREEDAHRAQDAVVQEDRAEAEAAPNKHRAAEGIEHQSPVLETESAPREPVLEARDVTVVFEGKSQTGEAIQVTACDNVSLALGKGEIVALVGESGSGKTTLARTLSLHQSIDDGEILLKGKPVRLTGSDRVKPRDYYGDVQMIFQDPFASLNHLKTIRHIIGRAVKLHSGLTSKKDVEQRTLELLETVHLTPAKDYIDRYPSALSGGQRQRISIARALAVDPTVILADEPTSMLDVSIRVDILNLLGELRRTKGVAILYITHDIASARYISDRMAVMYKGTMVELGETEQVVMNPRHEYTKTLISAAPDPSRRTRRKRAQRSGEHASHRKDENS